MHRIPLTLPLLALPLAAQAEAPHVVTDLPAVHSLVSQVMGELGAPELLLGAGASAHSYQLRPSQARSLQSADLVFWIGPEMTPWLERTLNSLGEGATQVALIDREGTTLREFAEEEDEHHEEDEHDHGTIDPHAWLDPTNAQHWLGVIAGALSQQDPENRPTYEVNAQKAAAAIAALDAQLTADLAMAQDTPFIVFHDAYGYFTSHFGLQNAGSVALGDAAAPGVARISALRQTLEDSGAACAFPEAQHDPKQMELLIEGTSVRLGGALDPSGSSLEPGPALYGQLLEKMSETLIACLSAR
ncbi:zinc ABC transporter substrate-binding protein [Thioclava sp. A2]|uniref:zinc ABC transporter substrate-binding protein n=1 Tax=Thioclava sp. FCG-A2 TaxID=3080562 RepID=UPI0029558EC8|nr:zinc ABC transporter substrate-binding protein [Thioclava sp. A2]